MNRRSFLMGLGGFGMMACSGGTRTGTSTQRPTPTSKAPPPPAGNTDLVWLMSQRHASRLAFHGDQLVASVDDELRSYSATTLKRTDTWKASHRHFCFMQDGTLVAFGFPPKGSASAIYRVVNGKLDTAHGPILPTSGTNVVLPGRTADEIFVTAQENIYALRTTGQLAATFAHPSPDSANRDQWFSRGDGHIVGIHRSEGFTLVSPDKTADYVAVADDRVVVHLAAATRDRLWYSYASLKQDYNAHVIALASVTKPTSDEQTIDVAPARVIHMASAVDTLAALVFEMHSHDDMKWSVVVYDESGHERWRVDVTALFSPRGVLNSAFVAIGEHSVALLAGKGDLLAWDVASGKALG